MSIEQTFTDSIALSTKKGDGIYTGTTYGWRDITGQVTVKGVGANDPDWTQIGSGPFFAYKFAVNDACWFVYHIPHDIVPSAPVHFHSHWITDGTNTAPVQWEFTYAYALGFDQEAFDMATGTTVTATQAASGTAYQHMVTETDAVTIPTLTEPDGLIYCRIRRLATSPTNSDGVFMLTSDVHYQSTNMATANRQPWFYRG